ncbi:MAG: hypothetical protein M1813_009239 [Trichoglossum hirsutum]|nr:MAG: hypothetical protein M1813_009239 [Trichoglossum hirsutum]
MSAPGKSLPLFCPFLVLTPPRSQTYVVISPYTLPAIEMVLHLREECEVQFPEIRFHEDEGAEMPGPEWIQSLVTHSLASGILREDLEVFYSRDRKKQVRSEDESVVLQFLLGTRHHMEVLLERTLMEFKIGLQRYQSLTVDKRFVRSIKGKLPSIGDLLDIAGKNLDDLKKSWDRVAKGRRNKISDPKEKGARVPTSSPRTNLIRLLVNLVISEAQEKEKENEKEKRRGKGRGKRKGKGKGKKKVETNKNVDAILADIGKHLNLQPAPKISNEWGVSSGFADGTPKVFFICNHPTTAGSRFYVGSSKENWGAFSEIGDIRRRDRDDRLRAYISLAEKAFYTLKMVEEKFANHAKFGEPIYETRSKAIIAMRRDHDFLGRTTETGQAFDKSMEPRECCYVCQGMVGYKTLAKFTQKQIRGNLQQFLWNKRGSYTHSCAEIDVSLQCSIDWQKSGKRVDR